MNSTLRPRLQMGRLFVLFIAFAVMLSVPAIAALADTLDDNLTGSSQNQTIKQNQDVTVKYWINPQNDGCEVSSTNKAIFSVVKLAEVTANKTTLEFSQCGSASSGFQEVTYTSGKINTQGNGYAISWNKTSGPVDSVGNANFNLKVEADTTAPTVTSVSPSEGATNVAANSNVEATFSEKMDSATINGTNFTLKQGTTSVATSVTYNANDKKATLDPSADLAANTTYTAQVTTGAKDLAGNALDQDSGTSGNQSKSWTFTTAAPPAPANNAPTVSTAAADASGDEGSQLTTNGVFADQDSSDTLTISKVSGEGTVTPGATRGTWSWAHTPTDQGSGTVVVQVSDGKGGQTTDSFDWSASNAAPTATLSSPDVDEGSNISVSLTSPSDPSSADTTAGFKYAFDCDTTDNTGYGSFGSTSSTTCSTTDNGTRSVGAKIQDKDGGVSTYTDAVAISNVPPDAVNDSGITTDEDTVKSNIDVLSNDTDVPADMPLSISSFDATSANGGTVTQNNADNTFNYDPADNFNDTDSFTYTVSDGDGGTDTATVSITVRAVNDAPVAGDDSATTDEDEAVTIDVLNNTEGKDTDVDGDTLNIASVTQPTNGTATITTDGKVEYAPSANFNGTDSFEYTVDDGNGGSDTATVSITVSAVNDAPVAVADSDTTAEDTAKDIDVLANDTDTESDTLSVSDFDAASAQGGTVSENNGKLNYAPAANFNGTDSFTYTVNDGTVDGNVATVSITVTAVNDAPVAEDQAASTNEDAALENEPLDVSDVDGGDTLSYTVDTEVANGTLEINTDGTFTYTPAKDYNGPDSFTYTVSDGNGGTDTATVSITVNAVNDAPVAANDDDEETDEDTLLRGSLSATDVDKDALSYSLVDDATNGSVSVGSDGSYTYTPDENFHGTDFFTFKASDGTTDSNVAPVSITVNPVNDAPVAADDDTASTPEDTPLNGNLSATDIDEDPLSYSKGSTDAQHGTVTVNADGTYTYTPDENFHGTDSFSFKANDGTTDSNEATVTIDVTPVNDAPVAADDSATTDEDTPLSESVSADDIDSSSLTYSLVAQAANGTVTVNADGSFTYTPNADYNGADSFTFKANDGELDSNTATVSITVNSVNDAPVPEDDSATTPEDTPVDILASELLNNDSEGPTDESNQILSIKEVSNFVHGTAVLSSDGSKVTFTPEANYYGAASFDYTVCDNGSPQKCSTQTATVNVTVSAVNDAPVADNDSYSVDEDGTLTEAAPGVLDGDTDVENSTLTATKVAGPSHGTLTLNSDGSFEYKPNANYHGSDSFTYTASDGELDSESATVSITVDPVNDAPTADAQSVSTDEDKATAITLSGSDIDGDSLTYKVASNPAHGQLSGTGANLTYTPDENYNGSDSFTFKANDGDLDSNTATVSITVNSVNDAPVAGDDNAGSTDEDAAKDNINVLGNDTDADSDILSVTSVTQGSSGSVTINSDSTLKYTPKANYHGPDSFTYTVSDGNNGTDTAKVSINVEPVNDAPTLSASNNGPVKEGSPVTITANANDADGDTLSYEFDCDNNGTYDKAPQSGSTYQCTFNDNGTSTVGVRATDGNGGEKTATTSVTIDNVAPTLGNLSLDGNTGTACATNNVKLAFSFDDPAKANDTYTGTIDWGDGSTTNFGSSFSVNESHDYKPGTYTIKVNVKDEDGGQAAEKQVQVSRQYQVTKLLDPVNANTDGKTPSVFKYGSTIPLKVKITDCNNNPVSGLAPKISIKQYNLATPSAGVNETILNTSTHSDYVMRDAGSGQYIYNLASKSLSDGDAQYTATVTDASFGSMQSQVWGLRTK